VNTSAAISVTAPNVTVGGTTATARYVIGTTTNAVNVGLQSVVVSNVTTVVSTGSGSAIKGNYIGTNKDGTAGLGSPSGGGVTGSAPKVTVGGADAGAGTLIAGGFSPAINATAFTVNGAILTYNGQPTAASGLVVQGNYIGTDKDGLVKIANA